jgi:hypothetical protein
MKRRTRSFPRLLRLLKREDGTEATIAHAPSSRQGDLPLRDASSQFQREPDTFQPLLAQSRSQGGQVLHRARGTVPAAAERNRGEPGHPLFFPMKRRTRPFPRLLRLLKREDGTEATIAHAPSSRQGDLPLRDASSQFQREPDTFQPLLAQSRSQGGQILHRARGTVPAAAERGDTRDPASLVMIDDLQDARDIR